MTPPLVTFIVPCFNYGHFLRDCLDSIFSQTEEPDFEVIAIDDCSTDDTLAVLASYADPRLRVIAHEKNLGHVGTMTEGLHESSGIYVARIDPDDRYRPGFLSKTLGIFRQHPDVALVYGDVSIIDGHGVTTTGRCDEVHGGRDFKGNEFVALLERNFICAPSVIAKREAWMDALPVPEGLAFNDWFFTLMIARKHPFYYIDSVLADYRVHTTNHHTRIAQNKTEETSIFHLLDRIFGEAEHDPALEKAKRRARNRIYAAHFLDMAEKYFYYRHNEDSLRCYARALTWRPASVLRPGPLRRILGLVIGRQRYESVKQFLRPGGAGSRT